MPNDDGSFTLRPRLTVSALLHPELHAQFKQVPANMHNALVMHMLVRIAVIDKHGGAGLAPAIIQESPKAYKPKVAKQEPSAPEGTHISEEQDSSTLISSTPAQPEPATADIKAMKDALGSLIFG